MSKFRSFVALVLVAIAVILFFVAPHAQYVQSTQHPVQTDVAPAIDYTVQLTLEYRTVRDPHIRRYADVTVWSNDDQVVSHVMHGSTRDRNEVETRLSGSTLIVTFRARTSDLVFGRITTSSVRDVHLSIAESTQYVKGDYEYVVAITEY